MRRSRGLTSVVIATAATAAWSSVALAQFEFWLPAAGTWDSTNGAAWSPDHVVPGSTNTAVVNGFRTATIASPVPTIQTLRLGDFNDGTLIFSNVNSSLTTTSDSHIGISASGTGNLYMNAGTFNVGGNFFIGFDSTANVTMAGGSLGAGGALWFRAGTSNFTQTGGTVSAANVYLAELASNHTVYTMSGGSLNISQNLYVGRSAGIDADGSFGQLYLNSGTITTTNLHFGSDTTDQLFISGSGVLLVNQNFYGTDFAAQDIADNKIVGNNLVVSTVNINGTNYTEVAQAAINSAWKLDTSGFWSDSSKWTANVPNGAGHAATFGQVINSARTVTLDAAETVGTLNFDNPSNSYTIAGSSTLTTLTMSVGSGSAAINVLSGNHIISAPLVFASDTNVNVAQASSTLLVTVALTATGKSITKSGAGTAQFPNIRAGSLNVSAGTLAIAANVANNDPAGTSVVQSVSISGGTLDLGNNSAIIDYSGSPGTLVNNVRQYLFSGALTSSSTTATRRLGFGDNAVLGKASFAGQNPDSTSLLIKFTLNGDSNLDGTVNALDFNALASNFGQSGSSWIYGDFNYDGLVNSSDFNALGLNFGRTLAAPALGALVPEPSALVAAGAAVLATMPRRRRG